MNDQQLEENNRICKADISIVPFQPEDQAAVKALILDGLVEHWGWLDPHKNPDLEDIFISYHGSVFLVARQAGQIVGTGALVSRSEDLGEIVRMSVATGSRRQGIGRLILKRLVEHARRAGMKRILLETTATWSEVINFYESCGFQLTHNKNGDAYFCLELPPPTGL